MSTDSLLPSGMFVMGGSFVFFRSLSALVRRMPVPVGAQETRRKTWTYWNILVSFIHSSITACLSTYCFFDEPAMLTDMIHTWTRLSYYLVAFSNGYFFHDLLDMGLNDFSNSKSLLVHHAVVCTAFFLAVVSSSYLAFGVAMLLMEVNSVFLHGRRLLSFNGFSKDSATYKINGLCLVGTFFIFRFLAPALIAKFEIQNRHLLPFSHFVLSCVGGIIIILLNINLFTTLWRADFRQKENKLKEKCDHKN